MADLFFEGLRVAAAMFLLLAAWAAFRADPEWIAGKAESEKDGSLVEKLTSVTLSPVAYIPQTA